MVCLSISKSKPAAFFHCVSHGPSAYNASDTNKTPGKLREGGSSAAYACPRCRAVYCELPIECAVCGITLVAAPHLARAYHHLFPLPTFAPVLEEAGADSAKGQANCTGCGLYLLNKPAVSVFLIGSTFPENLHTLNLAPGFIDWGWFLHIYFSCFVLFGSLQCA